ncbi:MAG: hypothetical protein IJE78_05715 [Bacteroidaceae bacterium]|nr:hypothetical protein [Bacteroidaceae bacterium]
MTRFEAIMELQGRENLDEATQVALTSLKSWSAIIEELQARIDLAQQCNAKDYKIGLDAALYLIHQHLNDEDVIY